MGIERGDPVHELDLYADRILDLVLVDFAHDNQRQREEVKLVLCDLLAAVGNRLASKLPALEIEGSLRAGGNRLVFPDDDLIDEAQR